MGRLNTFTALPSCQSLTNIHPTKSFSGSNQNSVPIEHHVVLQFALEGPSPHLALLRSYDLAYSLALRRLSTRSHFSLALCIHYLGFGGNFLDTPDRIRSPDFQTKVAPRPKCDWNLCCFSASLRSVK